MGTKISTLEHLDKSVYYTRWHTTFIQCSEAWINVCWDNWSDTHPHTHTHTHTNNVVKYQTVCQIATTPFISFHSYKSVNCFQYIGDLNHSEIEMRGNRTRNMKTTEVSRYHGNFFMHMKFWR